MALAIRILQVLGVYAGPANSEKQDAIAQLLVVFTVRLKSYVDIEARVNDVKYTVE